MADPLRPPIDEATRTALRARCDVTRRALEQASVEVQRTLREVSLALETCPHQGLEAAIRPGATATLRSLDAAKAWAAATEAIGEALATAERREAGKAQPGLFDGAGRAATDAGEAVDEGDDDPSPPVVLGMEVKTCPHGEPLGGVCPRCDATPPAPTRRRGRRGEARA